jgi:hypothetical protein
VILIVVLPDAADVRCAVATIIAITITSTMVAEEALEGWQATYLRHPVSWVHHAGCALSDRRQLVGRFDLSAAGGQDAVLAQQVSTKALSYIAATVGRTEHHSKRWQDSEIWGETVIAIGNAIVIVAATLTLLPVPITTPVAIAFVGARAHQGR